MGQTGCGGAFEGEVVRGDGAVYVAEGMQGVDRRQTAVRQTRR